MTDKQVTPNRTIGDLLPDFGTAVSKQRPTDNFTDLGIAPPGEIYGSNNRHSMLLGDFGHRLQGQSFAVRVRPVNDGSRVVEFALPGISQFWQYQAAYGNPTQAEQERRRIEASFANSGLRVATQGLNNIREPSDTDLGIEEVLRRTQQ